MSTEKAACAVERIDHVHVFVADRYEAAAWYWRTLGLETMKQYEHWAQSGRGPLMISPDDGNTKLALFESKRKEEPTLEGANTIAFRTNGQGFCQFLDRLYDYPVFDRKGKSASSLEIVDHDMAFSVYFNDPDGNSLELTTYDYEYVSKQGVELNASDR